MKPNFYPFLFFTIVLSGTIFAGALPNKKTYKTVIGSSVNVSQANSSTTPDLTAITKNLNTFLKKTGRSLPRQSAAVPQNSVRQNLVSPGQSNTVRNIHWNQETTTPRFIELDPTSALTSAGTQSAEKRTSNAKDFLSMNRSILKITDPQNEFQLKNLRTDQFQSSHLRFTQMYQGIEVWAKEIVVHTDARGNVISASGVYEPTPRSITNLEGTVDRSSAISEVLSDLEKKGITKGLSPDMAKLVGYAGPSAKKVIWHDKNHIPHLAWVVEVMPKLSQDWYYFIDAASGQVLNSYNNVCYDGATTGSGVDLNGVTRNFGTYQVGSNYYMVDASQPMFNASQSAVPDSMVGAIVGLDLRNHDLSSQSSIYYVASTNNQWTDHASISALYNAIVTYNYYRTYHNRNSIDDKGMTINSIIHATENGQPMENAFWSGQVMCYGDGQTFFKPLPGGLDVAAHEMTHGVTQYSAGLEYQDQSGALNESISDVFGTLVDTLNWTIGELVVKDLTTFPSGSLRDLSNPHNGGSAGSNAWQPATMSEFVTTTQDNGGVHVNSGIPNHAFYLAATAIGRHEAGQIWYRALTLYLTRSSQFVDARIATEKAATDLYGAASNEVTSIKSAWDGVGVVEGNATPPPPNSTLTGAEWILVTNTDPSDPNSIYMVKTTVTSSADYHPLTTTVVNNRPAVSDATGVIIFVDSDNNLRALAADPNNPQESLIDTSRVWNSVAIGPGLSSLALTSIFQDTTIYYFDLVANVAKSFKIVTQAFDAADVKTALYANALSFDPTGKFLLFDAYNQIKNSTGGTLNFWNINLLDIQAEKMSSVFPPLSEGINVGNPSYSKISPTRFTFDYLDTKKSQFYVYAADFNTGAVGTVAGPLAVAGYPTYSRDDKTIAYHTTEDVSGVLHESVKQMPLNANMIEGTGTSAEYVVDATYPDWFVIGTRTTDVKDNTGSLPYSFELMQNYPNPFNPSTKISYRLPMSSFVVLKIYDNVGREVSTLVNGQENAGRHEVMFDGSRLASGIYFYRIEAGSFVQTRKLVLMK